MNESLTQGLPQSGFVGGALDITPVLGRSALAVVACEDILLYPNGLAFTVHTRLRPHGSSAPPPAYLSAPAQLIRAYEGASMPVKAPASPRTTANEWYVPRRLAEASSPLESWDHLFLTMPTRDAIHLLLNWPAADIFEDTTINMAALERARSRILRIW